VELDLFTRSQLLIGTESLNKLKDSHVAIFGIGGVGSFATEALARTGVGEITLIDYDDICITNINRQIHATTLTVGQSKVEIMKKRILEINPNVKVHIYKELYNFTNAERLLNNKYDYVIDAIDMITSKLDLIVRCKEKNIPIISSMGAGNKLDPTKFVVEDIYKTSICPLAKVIRKELRKRDVKDLKVVYSKEKPLTPLKLNKNPEDKTITEDGINNSFQKRQTPGSVSFVPPVVGLIIASVVVKDLIGWNN